MAAEASAVIAGVEALNNIVERLHRRWSVYKGLEGDARAVGDRVEMVVLEVKAVRNVVDNCAPNQVDKLPIKGRLVAIERELNEAETLSKPLLDDLQQNKVLKRPLRFLTSKSIAENVRNLMDKLRDIRESLYETIRLGTMLDILREQLLSLNIKDQKGREFWESQIGSTEWSAPFEKIMDKYEAKRREQLESPGVTAGGEYKKLNARQKEAFLYALCWDAEEVTVAQELRPDEATVYCYKFDAFCQTFKWPFNPSELKDPPQVRIVHSTLERLSVAQMCLGLQDSFSRPEMRQVMEFVRKTVDSVVAYMEAKMDDSGKIEFDHGTTQYGPYQLCKLTHPANEDEQKRFRAAQMKCFAADYLFRTAAKKAERKLVLPDPDSEHPPPDTLADPGEKSTAPGPLSDTRPDAPGENSKAQGTPPGTSEAPGEKSDAGRKQTLRDVLDENRRVWSFAFQKFATLWKLGRLEEELFEGIDFPGTRRAITFMEYCEPLDEANLRLAIRKKLDRPDPLKPSEEWKEDETYWEESRPQVYTFLRAWIQYKDAKKPAAAGAPASRSARLPTPVRFGGIVTPLDEDGNARKIEHDCKKAHATPNEDGKARATEQGSKEDPAIPTPATPTGIQEFPPTPK